MSQVRTLSGRGETGVQGVVIIRNNVANHTVTYNTNGGTSVPSDSFATGGAIASAPTSPTKSGYEFAGWSATDGGTVISFPYSPGVSQDITLYATWTANVYTVTYNTNGATGSAEKTSDTYTYGGTALTL